MCNVILTGFVIAPEQDIDALLSAIPEHLRETRAHPKCHKFEILRDKSNPFKFSVYVVYDDAEALDNHWKRIKNSKWGNVSKRLERHYSVIEDYC